MAHPPYFQMEKEAQRMFHKTFDECSEEEQQLCEDMAWEYCGCSPQEAAQEEYERKNGKIY